MKFVRPEAAYLALALISPMALGAQMVQGRVRDTVRDAPISGALVELRDTTGTVRARTMSGAGGTFALMLPPGSRFDLRVIAIGYSPRALPAVSSGQLGDLVMTPHAITLPAIRALAESKGCRATGQMDTYARLYDAATGALEVMKATIESRSRAWTVVEEYRVLDGNRVIDTNKKQQGLTDWPIASIDTDSLRDYGFAIPAPDDGNALIWHGPDLAVLFADWFQDRHCFTVREPDAKRDYITIAYEPVKDAKKLGIVELAGEIRLDPATLAVRELLYTHVNLPAMVRKDVAGGVVRFAVDGTGTWVPVYWSIRAPMAVRARNITRTIVTSGNGRLPPDATMGAPVMPRMNISVERIGRVVDASGTP